MDSGPCTLPLKRIFWLSSWLLSDSEPVKGGASGTLFEGQKDKLTRMTAFQWWNVCLSGFSTLHLPLPIVRYCQVIRDEGYGNTNDCKGDGKLA